MALDFPNSPAIGDVFESGANEKHFWRYNGTYWEATSKDSPHCIASRQADIVLAATDSSFNFTWDTITSDPFGLYSSPTFAPPSGLEGLWLMHMRATKTGTGVLSITPVYAPLYALAFPLVLATGATSNATFATLYWSSGGSTGFHVTETSGSAAATLTSVEVMWKKL